MDRGVVGFLVELESGGDSLHLRSVVVAGPKVEGLVPMVVAVVPYQVVGEVVPMVVAVVPFHPSLPY